MPTFLRILSLDSRVRLIGKIQILTGTFKVWETPGLCPTSTPSQLVDSTRRLMSKVLGYCCQQLVMIDSSMIPHLTARFRMTTWAHIHVEACYLCWWRAHHWKRRPTFGETRKTSYRGYYNRWRRVVGFTTKVIYRSLKTLAWLATTKSTNSSDTEAALIRRYWDSRVTPGLWLRMLAL
jgi:hypothetical protein